LRHVAPPMDHNMSISHSSCNFNRNLKFNFKCFGAPA
jgi:hypothetical protein